MGSSPKEQDDMLNDIQTGCHGGGASDVSEELDDTSSLESTGSNKIKGNNKTDKNDDNDKPLLDENSVNDDGSNHPSVHDDGSNHPSVHDDGSNQDEPSVHDDGSNQDGASMHDDGSNKGDSSMHDDGSNKDEPLVHDDISNRNNEVRLEPRHEQDVIAPPSIVAGTPKKAPVARPSVTSSGKKRGRPRKIKNKRPKDMPTRPLSAYNYFFREERIKWLEEKPDVLDKTNVPEEPAPGGRKVKSRLFESMAKEVARRWKELPQDMKQSYLGLAEEDMKRYRIDIEKYQTKLKAENGGRKPKKAKIAKTQSPANKKQRPQALQVPSEPKKVRGRRAKSEGPAKGPIPPAAAGFPRQVGRGVIGPKQSKASMLASGNKPMLAAGNKPMLAAGNKPMLAAGNKSMMAAGNKSMMASSNKSMLASSNKTQQQNMMSSLGSNNPNSVAFAGLGGRDRGNFGMNEDPPFGQMQQPYRGGGHNQIQQQSQLSQFGIDPVPQQQQNVGGMKQSYDPDWMMQAQQIGLRSPMGKNAARDQFDQGPGMFSQSRGVNNPSGQSFDLGALSDDQLRSLLEQQGQSLGRGHGGMSSFDTLVGRCQPSSDLGGTFGGMGGQSSNLQELMNRQLLQQQYQQQMMQGQPLEQNLRMPGGMGGFGVNPSSHGLEQQQLHNLFGLQSQGLLQGSSGNSSGLGGQFGGGGLSSLQGMNQPFQDHSGRDMNSGSRRNSVTGDDSVGIGGGMNNNYQLLQLLAAKQQQQQHQNPSAYGYNDYLQNGNY